jgi:hypothetical protein
MTAIERPDWADRMRAALDSAGLCETDLAAFLGVAPDAVAQWLDGEEIDGVYFLSVLTAVIAKTGVSPYWIVTGQTAPASDQLLN